MSASNSQSAEQWIQTARQQAVDDSAYCAILEGEIMRLHSAQRPSLGATDEIVDALRAKGKRARVGGQDALYIKVVDAIEIVTARSLLATPTETVEGLEIIAGAYVRLSDYRNLEEANKRLLDPEATRLSSPSHIEPSRVDAALHACEGLDTVDLAKNDKGWLADVVLGASCVESQLNRALRACCAGNTDEDEPVRCQSYEASEQNKPCPRGRCVMAEPEAVCSECKGAGTVSAMTTHLGPDDHTYDAECPKCGGSGICAASAIEPRGTIARDAMRYRWLRRTAEQRPGWLPCSNLDAVCDSGLADAATDDSNHGRKP